MPSRKAGVISIQLSAGTATFIADMDKANAKIRQFGSGMGEAGKRGVSEMKATSAAAKLIEGDFFRNSRAVDGFLEKTLHLGPVLQAAFPIVGGLAFGGMIVETGSKVQEFFTKMREAPNKSAQAFRELNDPIKSLNDNLETTNSKLENQLTKLEGRKENGLKVALLEARDAADKLADSLAKDVAGLRKVLEQNEIGTMKAFFTGTGATTDIGEQFKKFQKDEAEIKRSGQARIDSAVETGDPGAVKAATQELNNRLLGLYNRELDETNKKLAETQRLAVPSPRTRGGGRPTRPGENDVKASTDLEVRTQQLIDVRDNLEQSMRQIPLGAKEADLKGKIGSTEAANEAAKPGKVYSDKISEINAEIEAARDKLAAVGKPESEQIELKGSAEAAKAITEINKRLDELKAKHDAAKEAEIKRLEVTKAGIEMGASWKSSVDQITRSNDEEIRSLELLTAAIGQGYDATKKAAVETEVLKVRSKFGDEWMAQPENQPDIEKVKTSTAARFDAQHAQATTAATDSLNDQIELEKALVVVQNMGREQIERTTLAWRIQQLATKGARTATGELTDEVKKQIAAEQALFEAKRNTEAAGGVAKIQEQITAIRLLTAAEIHGAEAVRKATLENKYTEMATSGAAPATIDKAREEDQAAHELEITKQVSSRVNVYKDHLAQLDQEKAKLLEMVAINGQTADTERALRDIENERLQVLVKQSLELGSMRDGLRAFFLEMQEQGKTAAQSVYDALNEALDRTSDNLAKLLSGQKTSWGQMFQDIGHNLLKDSIKDGMQQGLGALGKAFPGISGITDKLSGAVGGKPDGTASKPYHVVMEGGARPTAIPGLPGVPGRPGAGGGLFGSGVDRVNPAIFSFLSDALKKAPRSGGGEIPRIGGIGDDGAVPPWVQHPGPIIFDRIKPATGALGLPSTGGMGGPNGSKQNPFYVVAEGGKTQPKNKPSGIGGLLQRIGMGIFGAATGNLGDIAGAIGGGGGGDTPDVSSSISFPGIDGERASGGPVQPGKMFLVGEKGQELFVPPSHGHIINAEKTKQLMTAHKFFTTRTTQRGDGASAKPFHASASPVHRADGGDVSAGHSYITGERGPEMYLAASSMTVQGASDRSSVDYGGHHVHIGNIDARGSDEANMRRQVALAVQAGYEKAVGTSVQVHHDQARRKPAGRP